MNFSIFAKIAINIDTYFLTALGLFTTLAQMSMCLRAAWRSNCLPQCGQGTLGSSTAVNADTLGLAFGVMLGDVVALIETGETISEATREDGDNIVGELVDSFFPESFIGFLFKSEGPSGLKREI